MNGKNNKRAFALIATLGFVLCGTVRGMIIPTNFKKSLSMINKSMEVPLRLCKAVFGNDLTKVKEILKGFDALGKYNLFLNLRRDANFLDDAVQRRNYEIVAELLSGLDHSKKYKACQYALVEMGQGSELLKKKIVRCSNCFRVGLTKF